VPDEEPRWPGRGRRGRGPQLSVRLLRTYPTSSSASEKPLHAYRLIKI
jgi:hypothetical protein